MSPTLLRKHIDLELAQHPPRERSMWLGRMGFGGEVKLLEPLGREHGVSREWARLATERMLASMRRSPWAHSMDNRISRLLRGRTSPLCLDAIADEDRWFRGFEGREVFLATVIARCSPSPRHTWQLGDRWIAAEIGEDEWNSLRQTALAELAVLAERHTGEAGVMKRLERLATAAGAWSLKHALKDSVGPSLQFVRGRRPGQRKLLEVGDTLTKAARAVMVDAGEPLPIGELQARVAQRLGRKVLAVPLRRAVKLAGAHPLGWRCYGLVEHVGLSREQRASVVRQAERLVLGGAVGRQWHAGELAEAVTEARPELAGRLNSYSVSALLRESGKLRDLRRMMWGHPQATKRHGQGRKRVVEVLEAVLEEAGGPMRPKDIRRAALRRRGFSGTFQMYPCGRVVMLGGGLWGLTGRDD